MKLIRMIYFAVQEDDCITQQKSRIRLHSVYWNFISPGLVIRFRSSARISAVHRNNEKIMSAHLKVQLNKYIQSEGIIHSY